MKYTLEIETFDLGDTRDKARKVVEEAAEAFSAWESLTREPHRTIRQAEADMDALAYEAMDNIQACCNLLAALCITQEQLDKAARAVRMKNTERGRYVIGGVTVEPPKPTLMQKIRRWFR